MSTAASIPFYFDCDTGIDDTLALLYLISRTQHRVVGIGTVSGNVSAEQGARNTLDLLALAGRTDIPVAVGQLDHWTAPYEGGPAHVHGVNGLGDVELPRGGDPVGEDAADMLIRLSREYPGELQVIAIGPMTNLALALERDPSVADRVARVTIMGGNALVPGNITPAAEANIWHDAEAAAALFDAAWPVTMVGLDVTMRHRLTEEQRQELLAAEGELQQAVGNILDVYYRFYEPIFGRRECTLHDPLAVAVATGDVVPDLAPVVKVKVDASHGLAHGATIADLRGMYAGYPPVDGARHTVVLEVKEPFGPQLQKVLLEV